MFQKLDRPPIVASHHETLQPRTVIGEFYGCIYERVWMDSPCLESRHRRAFGEESRDLHRESVMHSWGSCRINRYAQGGERGTEERGEGVRCADVVHVPTQVGEVGEEHVSTSGRAQYSHRPVRHHVAQEGSTGPPEDVFLEVGELPTETAKIPYSGSIIVKSRPFRSCRWSIEMLQYEVQVSVNRQSE